MTSDAQKDNDLALVTQLTEQDEQSLLALSQQEPHRYQQLHEQALSYLNKQLLGGDAQLETLWVIVYERLANFFFARDTAALLQLTTTAAELPLQTTSGQQLRQYFQAVAYFRQAQYAAALDTFTAVLQSDRLDIQLRARALNARSVVYRVTGNFEAAMAGYRQSLALWQTLGDDYYQGIVNINLGIISYNLRRYETAAHYLQQAETFFQAAGSTAWYLKTQSELGLVQRDLGQWPQALAYFDTYIAQSEAREAWEDVGIGEINRGEVLLFQGDITSAKTALQRALALTVSQTYRVDPLLYLGLAHQADGEWAQAESYYREALALAVEIDRREVLPHVYFHLGDVLRRQGQGDTAVAYWQQAAEVIQQSRQPLQDETLKISLLGRWQQVYEALVLQCLHLGRDEEAFIWAERARAQAFAEGIVDGDEEERPFLSTISLAELQTLIPPQHTLLCYFTTGVLEQDIPLLRAIPKENPLREHILTPAKIVLFVITADTMQAQRCALDPNLFATLSPRGFDAKRFLQTAVLQRLHKDLLGTVTNKHLIFIPHGPLHRVPFTALLSLSPQMPTVSFAPSATIYGRQREAAKDKASKVSLSCLAIGYNQIDDARELKYATVEAEQIAKIMHGQAAVDGSLSKADLGEQAANCRYLHIACHGWFDNQDPMSSYVTIGANTQLTAREILETWSLQAELVTLSACETGVSQILRGDEPMGLVRALLYAGAKAVLVSQWTVDDLATFLLMLRFYQELQDAADFPSALGRAQQWLREATTATLQQFAQQQGLAHLAVDWVEDESPFADPIYWAGFVLVGI